MGCCCKKKSPSDINIVISHEPFIKKSQSNDENTNPLEHKISKTDFIILKTLGKGSFATVYLVRSKFNKKLYSMKELDKSFIKLKQQENHTITERILMAKINNPFIVKLYCCFQDKKHLYFLMEFVQGGELFFHLHRETRFDDEKTKFYIAELILALDFLHKNKIIYRDLKPENILLGTDGHIKLTDFGLSKLYKKEKEKAYTICGSPYYLAPEILKQKGYGDSVDWWSLGCLMYEMLSGKPPFNITGTKITLETYNQQVKMMNCFSEEAKDLMEKLLKQEPEERLGSEKGGGVEKIKEHAYFQDINWEEMEKKIGDVPFIPEVSDEMDLRYFEKMFIEEGNITRESIEDSRNKTIDNYVNFSYVNDGAGSLRNNNGVNLNNNSNNLSKEENDNDIENDNLNENNETENGNEP